MGALYVNENRLHATDYMEVYIPLDYFDDKFAINRGNNVETFGIIYIRSYTNGSANNIQLLNIPAVINLMLYDSIQEEIMIKDTSLKVMTLKFSKDSYVMNKSLQKGRLIAEAFLNSILMGKLPSTLDYAHVIDIWWTNLSIAGVNYKVPSKIQEMIIASIYRNKSNFKQRFGQVYGQSANSNGYDYETGNVRDVVESLSTFSGMVFEDMGRMVTNGINNSIDGYEEPVSPLEKIIYY